MKVQIVCTSLSQMNFLSVHYSFTVNQLTESLKYDIIKRSPNGNEKRDDKQLEPETERWIC